MCSFLGNVVELFPEDQLLIDMKIKSDIGIPLFSFQTQRQGLIVILSEGVLSQKKSEKLIRLMKLLNSKIEAELERYVQNS